MPSPYVGCGFLVVFLAVDLLRIVVMCQCPGLWIMVGAVVPLYPLPWSYLHAGWTRITYLPWLYGLQHTLPRHTHACLLFPLPTDCTCMPPGFPYTDSDFFFAVVVRSFPRHLYSSSHYSYLVLQPCYCYLLTAYSPIHTFLLALDYSRQFITELFRSTFPCSSPVVEGLPSFLPSSSVLDCSQFTHIFYSHSLLQFPHSWFEFFPFGSLDAWI